MVFLRLLENEAILYLQPRWAIIRPLNPRQEFESTMQLFNTNPVRAAIFSPRTCGLARLNEEYPNTLSTPHNSWNVFRSRWVIGKHVPAEGYQHDSRRGWLSAINLGRHRTGTLHSTRTAKRKVGTYTSFLLLCPELTAISRPLN